MKRLARTLACVAVLSVASQQSQGGVIYSEDFESGTAPGWGLSGLWHVTENAPASGRYALGYVQNETPGPTPNGDYDTRINDQSIQNDGYATAPTILLPAGTATLSFDVLSDVEVSSPYITDFLAVIPGQVFAFNEVLAGNSGGGGFADPLIPTDGTYHRVAVDISAYAGGPFTWSFCFATFDEFFNDFPGIRIDNVEIDSSPIPEPSTLVLSSIVFGTCWAFRRLKRITAA